MSLHLPAMGVDTQSSRKAWASAHMAVDALLALAVTPPRATRKRRQLQQQDASPAKLPRLARNRSVPSSDGKLPRLGRIACQFTSACAHPQCAIHESKFPAASGGDSTNISLAEFKETRNSASEGAWESSKALKGTKLAAPFGLFIAAASEKSAVEQSADLLAELFVDLERVLVRLANRRIRPTYRVVRDHFGVLTKEDLTFERLEQMLAVADGMLEVSRFSGTLELRQRFRDGETRVPRDSEQAERQANFGRRLAAVLEHAIATEQPLPRQILPPRPQGWQTAEATTTESDAMATEPISWPTESAPTSPAVAAKACAEEDAASTSDLEAPGC